MTRGAQVSEDEVRRAIEVIHECLGEGFPPNPTSTTRGAVREAAERMGISRQTLENRLATGARRYGLKWDEAFYRPKAGAPIFEVDSLPDDGELSADELIAALKAKDAKRREYDNAARLREVRIHTPGPIAVAFFGDPHVDDPGCAWSDLERDVTICRDTPGMMAVDVGDDSNNWVGRLMKLYADQEVTSKQALTLIEWLMTSLPWLLRIKGNHDEWNGEKGDVADYIHRLAGAYGVLQSAGQRMRLHLPAGPEVFLHVRHDFPGGSQFNPAHALVRETLFGFRDHIMACGHRHSSGYIPIFHNDPRRLCHGFRVGTYKDRDKFARDKHFQENNWARSMAAVIDPDYADDPARFIKPFYSLEDASDYLTWKRRKFEVGRRAA